MDREIVPEVRRRRVAKRAAAAALVVTAIVFFFVAAVRLLRPSIDRDAVRIARVERGAVEATLQANGTVVPLTEQVVSSPVEARVLRIGRRAGDRVKPGDELLALDTAASRLDADRLFERVAQKESETTQLRLKLDDTVASLRAQIEQKRLDREILRYTSEQKSKLLTAGLVAEQDARAAETAARKSEIELQQLGEALQRTLRANAAQLAAAERDLGIARREETESRRQLALAMMRADREGILTSIITEVGATVRRGDVIARIADLSAYRVEASISDIHAARLAAGMRAYVRLEGATVPGTIENVDPRIVNGVVRFYVRLDEPSHRGLRNNLRADVDVVVGRRSGVLRVTRGVLGRTAANTAFVVRGGDAVRVPVRFGVAGEETIEIEDGLGEGDEVVISDMTEYEGVTQVKLK